MAPYYTLMFNVILYQPEIPPNTGNIMRLCANTGTTLHLIEPLGFKLEDRKMRRAGLDYIDWERLHIWPSLNTYLSQVTPSGLYAISTRGQQYYSDCRFSAGDSFLFGPETRGLPPEVLSQFETDRILRIPMCAHSRSMNLANAAAVVLYEAWRQKGFRFPTG